MDQELEKIELPDSGMRAIWQGVLDARTEISQLKKEVETLKKESEALKKLVFGKPAPQTKKVTSEEKDKGKDESTEV